MFSLQHSVTAVTPAGHDIPVLSDVTKGPVTFIDLPSLCPRMFQDQDPDRKLTENQAFLQEVVNRRLNEFSQVNLEYES